MICCIEALKYFEKIANYQYKLFERENIYGMLFVDDLKVEMRKHFIQLRDEGESYKIVKDKYGWSIVTVFLPIEYDEGGLSGYDVKIEYKHLDTHRNLERTPKAYWASGGKNAIVINIIRTVKKIYPYS